MSFEEIPKQRRKIRVLNPELMNPVINSFVPKAIGDSGDPLPMQPERVKLNEEVIVLVTNGNDGSPYSIHALDGLEFRFIAPRGSGRAERTVIEGEDFEFVD